MTKKGEGKDAEKSGKKSSYGKFESFVGKKAIGYVVVTVSIALFSVAVVYLGWDTVLAEFWLSMVTTFMTVVILLFLGKFLLGDKTEFPRLVGGTLMTAVFISVFTVFLTWVSVERLEGLKTLSETYVGLIENVVAAVLVFAVLKATQKRGAGKAGVKR